MNIIAKIEAILSHEVIGRIGGNIPDYFMDKLDNIREFNFYASFQHPENKDKYITILVPKSYNDMIDNNIYPDCSVKVFVHTLSSESNNKGYTIEHIKKTTITGYTKVSQDEFNFITKSESPTLIQDEEYYYENLKKDGYEFFMQLDEDYYPDNIIDGNYIFGYGALYLYRNLITGEIIAGFWQYS